jgi:hypothetical protein
MNNIQGYILGLFSCALFSVIFGIQPLNFLSFVNHIDLISLNHFLPQFLGAIIACLIISYPAKLYSKFNEFGVVFGYTSLFALASLWFVNYFKDDILTVAVVFGTLAFYFLYIKKSKTDK